MNTMSYKQTSLPGNKNPKELNIPILELETMLGAGLGIEFFLKYYLYILSPK